MTEPILQIILPGFILIFLSTIFLWSKIRRKAFVIQTNEYNNRLYDSYIKMMRVDTLMKFILIIFSIMIIIYTIAPEIYYLFVPFEKFNHPVINSLGLLILKISLAWVVVAQINIDKEIYKLHKKMSSIPAFDLFIFSQKQLLGGLLVMFIGMSITITNLVGILLCTIALVLYFKMK